MIRLDQRRPQVLGRAAHTDAREGGSQANLSRFDRMTRRAVAGLEDPAPHLIQGDLVAAENMPEYEHGSYESEASSADPSWLCQGFSIRSKANDGQHQHQGHQAGAQIHGARRGVECA